MSCRPMAACAKCGREFPVEVLRLLPEVESFQRTFAMSMKNGTPSPAMLSEEDLKQKYGFGSMDLFCESCLLTLVSKK